MTADGPVQTTDLSLRLVDVIEARDLDDPDMLLGGDGNDEIQMGSGDVAMGEGGADIFYTGTWVDPDNAPVIADLEEDEVVIVSVPEGASADALVSLVTEETTGNTLVQVNSQTVASVAAEAGTVSLSQIIVVDSLSIAAPVAGDDAGGDVSEDDGGEDPVVDEDDDDVVVDDGDADPVDDDGEDDVVVDDGEDDPVVDEGDDDVVVDEGEDDPVVDEDDEDVIVDDGEDDPVDDDVADDVPADDDVIDEEEAIVEDDDIVIDPEELVGA